jgi:glucosamine-6-phosphate deaminase
MADYSFVSADELLRNSKIPLAVVETEYDIYHEMARIMFDEIAGNNAAGKNTVLIVPVGPTGQYRRFARLANIKKLDCSKVYIFNMDEYMLDEKTLVPVDHPLSFKGFMDKELYDLLEGASVIPTSHQFFPTPGREGEIWEKIQELGGVDVAMGGIGIRGHIAFNEAPLENDLMPDEEFAQLPTRVLPLTKETLTINAANSYGGYIDGIPKWCITIGMKEILSSRKLRFFAARNTQRGIIRGVCLGDITKFRPASFLQRHPDALITMIEQVTQIPAGNPK